MTALLPYPLAPANGPRADEQMAEKVRTTKKEAVSLG
jgi:hypothetical protein